MPSTVDYDFWCGPAPMHPPRRARFHYDWHWFWDYGAGDVGNQGVHEMDVARWFLGEKYVAPKTLSIGGRFGYVDDAETPNTLITFHDYYNAPLIMEVRGLPEKTGAKEMDQYRGATIGVVVECEGGASWSRITIARRPTTKTGRNSNVLRAASELILPISSKPCAAVAKAI